jgi:hypothetical protein
LAGKESSSRAADLHHVGDQVVEAGRLLLAGRLRHDAPEQRVEHVAVEVPELELRGPVSGDVDVRHSRPI